MTIRKIVLGLILSLTAAMVRAEAPVQEATVTRVEGEAMLFFAPAEGKKPAGPPPHAVLDGQTYSVKPAKAGDKMAYANVLQTGKSGKVRVIYKNGDMITVTPGSAYKVTWSKKRGDKPTVDLLFGKIRTMVLPDGPRNDLSVRSKSMVMGVRGTDFYASGWSASGGSEVTVLRGSVAVAPKPKENAPAGTPPPKPIEVRAGFSAAIPVTLPKEASGKNTAGSKKPDEAAAAFVLRPTNKVEIATMQQETKVEVKAAPDDPKTSAAIKELESQATTAAVSDIKAHDPELYKQIAGKIGTSVNADEIDKINVTKMIEKAPEAPVAPEKSQASPPAKPSAKEFEEGKDPYKTHEWKGED